MQKPLEKPLQFPLAEGIRRAIRDADHSANELSAFSGVSRAIICRFLKNERTITVATAESILAGLGCTVEIKRPRSFGELVAVKRKQKKRGKKKPPVA